MSLSLAERHRLAVVGWIATVLTSLALFTALQEKKFIILAAALSALVVAIGMLMRQVHLPTLLAPVVQVVVAGEILVVTYGHHMAYQLIPTPETWSSLNTTITNGMDVANRYAAPVPPNAGLMLITVGFITLIAIVVDLLAAGFARAPLAGLALLALYAVPVASLPDGVPAILFIPGAAAFMSLLMISERERLAHWGRHVATSTARDASEAVDTSGLASTGRRISLMAIATAVVLPILVPTFTTSLFHGENGVGPGDGSVSFSDPMVSLADALHRKDPVDLMQVVSGVTPTYLRLAVLDQPGPVAWRNSGTDLSTADPIGGTLPTPEGLGDDVSRIGGSMNVQLLPSFPRDDSVWLPVPGDLRSLSFSNYPGEFAFVPGDSTVTSKSTDSLSHVSSYIAAYVVPQPTDTELEHSTAVPDTIVTKYGSVPSGVPAVVGDVARSVTRGYTSNYDKALALQSFFRDKGNFTYDLNAGYGDGYRAMAAFLEKRRGFCQHFAATMAMMARELGIPSRVVVGFLDPSKIQGGNQYVFTSDDAHAWPELYFGGLGWVRFEPTPGNDATPPPYTHAVQIPVVKATTPTKPTTTNLNTGGGKNTDDVPSTSAAITPSGGPSGSGGGGSVPAAPWLILIAVVALALTPGTVRLGIRRSRLARALDGGDSSEYAWTELRDRILDLRLPWTGSLTPRARSRFIEPLLGGDPYGVASLDRLALIVERARYAPTPVADADPARDARAIMAAIAQGVDRKRRVKAFLWPSSLMPELRTSSRRLKARLARRPELRQS